MPAVYGEPKRPLQIRKPDDTYRLIQLNSEPYPDEKNPGQLVQYPVEEVDHAIAVSSGPSYNSQREQVASFIDMLIQNLPNMPWIPPPVAAQLLAIAIKMKNLGPQGDQMAELISPSPGSPDQAMAQMQQAQAQLQQQGVQIQQLQAIVQQLSQERQMKVVEGEYKMQLEKLRSETNLLVERLKVDAQMATAQIQTKSQMVSERAQAITETDQQAREQMHEAQLAERQRDHELRLAQQEYLRQALEAQQQAQPALEAQP
jgi:hypothetical protein